MFQGDPPDEHMLDELRLMCLKNINDDYCVVQLAAAIRDKGSEIVVSSSIVIVRSIKKLTSGSRHHGLQHESHPVWQYQINHTSPA